MSKNPEKMGKGIIRDYPNYDGRRHWKSEREKRKKFGKNYKREKFKTFE
jgi:hypothetical protein